MFSFCRYSLIVKLPFLACFAYGRNAANLAQCDISMRSLAPHDLCLVLKPYLEPMISPSKYVVRVG